MEVKRFENTIHLATGTMHEEELKYIHEAFDTGWVTTAGSNLDELEKNIIDLLKINGAVSTGSGTSALHLAVKLAGVKQDDVVFAQSLTFDATVNPAMYEKAKLVFIDSERDTMIIIKFLDLYYWNRKNYNKMKIKII